MCARVRVTQDLNSSIVKNGFRRRGFTGFQRAGMTKQGRAIRADDLIVCAHVQKHMRMIERSIGTGALKLVCADLDHGNAHIIVKFRGAGAHHVSACLKFVRFTEFLVLMELRLVIAVIAAIA